MTRKRLPTFKPLMTRKQQVMRPSPIIGVVLLLLLHLVTPRSHAATDTFVYAGCSPQQYTPGSPYESNLTSLLTSLLTSSSSSTFSNVTAGTAFGLFQCRPDLASAADCSTCVSTAIAQLGAVCPDALAAALRLEGCYVRYANASFFGVEDKTLVLTKCGPQLLDSGEWTRRDSVLSYLAAGTQLFRVGADGGVSGVAECVGGLSGAQCQDCLSAAVARLRSQCWYASSGDVFLATCYARYTVVVSNAPTPKTESSTSDAGTQKTLAIIIGTIAVVGLIVIFAAFLKKRCKDDNKCCDQNHK